MNLKLIGLNREYEQQLGEMICEWKADQERNHTNCSPWVIFKNDYHDFDSYLEHLETKEAVGELVPDSVFFLLDEDQNRLLGAVNIRHYLNETLMKEGGHIGDGIRPSERRKGYATEMIRLALIECKKLGIDRVLMIHPEKRRCPRMRNRRFKRRHSAKILDCPLTSADKPSGHTSTDKPF